MRVWRRLSRRLFLEVPQHEAPQDIVHVLPGRYRSQFESAMLFRGEEGRHALPALSELEPVGLC